MAKAKMAAGESENSISKAAKIIGGGEISQHRQLGGVSKKASMAYQWRSQRSWPSPAKKAGGWRNLEMAK